MAIYRFKVSNSTGAIETLVIEGDSQSEAARRIQRRGLIPLEFLGEGALASEDKRLLGIGKRFDVVDFTDRLVPLLEAQIPLERALGIVSEGVDDGFSERLINDLRRGLHEGRKLSQLIRDRGRIFPNLYANAVEAGEEAGALPEVMAELRRFLNKSREFRSFLISSSIYPLIVLTVSFLLISFLLGFIVPRFAEVIINAGGDMSWSTNVLLLLSKSVKLLWWLPLIMALGCLVLFQQFRGGGQYKSTMDNAVLRIPVIGKIVLYSNLARLCRTMSILMRSGVHLLDTVSISTRILQNNTLRQSFAGLEAELRQGQRLSHALGHSRYVPQFMMRMLTVGEETGNVEVMLERVAERYENDLRQLFSRIISLFEPAVIVVLGLLVGGVVLTMFLAIMDMQSGL